MDKINFRAIEILDEMKRQKLIGAYYVNNPFDKRWNGGVRVNIYVTGGEAGKIIYFPTHYKLEEFAELFYKIFLYVYNSGHSEVFGGGMDLIVNFTNAAAQYNGMEEFPIMEYIINNF